MMDGCELTILMPCLDEAETVGICVRKARGFLESASIEGEVLVADNGSTDGSREIARDAGARVVEAERRGYGAALMKGISEARGRYVIMGDADDSYDFTSLDPFVEKLRKGYDLVVGNRFTGGIEDDAMPFLHRYLGNPVLSWIGRLFFEDPVRDFHCGLRGFRRDAIRELELTSPGMEFASEMVVKSSLQGLEVTEVPTTLSPDGRSRDPHLRKWRDGWRHLRFLLLFSPRWLFLYPGMCLMAVGLGVMLWLLPGPRHVAGVGLDVNTLLYAGAGVVCGFQAVSFWLLGKTFAIDQGLLPADPVIRTLTDALSLEVGLGLGFLLVAAGTVGSLYAVGFWGGAAFGPLDPQVSLRIVVPSVTALILGIQLVLSSFFLSLLKLRRT